MSSYRSYYKLLEMSLNFLEHIQSQSSITPLDYNPHIRTNPFQRHRTNQCTRIATLPKGQPDVSSKELDSQFRIPR